MDLGICAAVTGAVLYGLVFNTGIHGCFENKMQMVWAQVERAYRELGTHVGERVPFSEVVEAVFL